MRVLIVEDEPNLGRQLRSTLEGAGYAVDLATDGEDGHYLGSTESYDAVILDLGLPEIDGLTVLDRWRKEGRKMPVLVLTARDAVDDRVRGLDLGVRARDPQPTELAHAAHVDDLDVGGLLHVVADRRDVGGGLALDDEH